jgi:hypothetical protein
MFTGTRSTRLMASWILKLLSSLVAELWSCKQREAEQDNTAKRELLAAVEDWIAVWYGAILSQPALWSSIRCAAQTSWREGKRGTGRIQDRSPKFKRYLKTPLYVCFTKNFFLMNLSYLYSLLLRGSVFIGFCDQLELHDTEFLFLPVSTTDSTRFWICKLSLSIHSSSLKMRSIRSCETSVNFY